MAQMVKSLPAVQETQIRSLGWEDPLEKGMVTTPVFLPGESHGQRKLTGYTVHGVANNWTPLSNICLSDSFLLSIYTTLSLAIHWLMDTWVASVS